MFAPCLSCGTPLEVNVFPGVVVQCGQCGASLQIPNAAGKAPQGARSPYRAPTAQAAGPQPRPTAAHDLNAGPCPRCPGVNLEPRFDDFVCPRCTGMFVPHLRLRHLVDEHRATGLRPLVPAQAFDRNPITYLPCPMCTVRMNRRNFGDSSGVLVDVCKAHGVWFDAGELEAALAHAFDLPEDSAARAALLALVKRELPPPAKQPDVPSYEINPLLRSGDRRMNTAITASEHLETVFSWLHSLFR